MSSFLSGD